MTAIDVRNFFRMRLALSHCSAVHNHDFAVHITVSVGTHKRRELGEFRRLAASFGRVPEVVHLQQAFGERVGKVGIEDSGGDGVDGDAEVRGFA